MLLTKTEFYELIVEFGTTSKIEGWLWKYCRRTTVLDDLKQEVIARLMDSDHEKIVDLDRFVYGICQHVGVDWVREATRKAKWVVSMDATGESLSACDPNNPEKAISLIQDLQQLRAAINGLPRIRRLVYRLHHVRGYSIEEIAKRTKRRPATVKRTLYDAMRSIRKTMAKGESGNNAQPTTRPLGHDQ